MKQACYSLYRWRNWGLERKTIVIIQLVQRESGWKCAWFQAFAILCPKQIHIFIHLVNPTLEQNKLKPVIMNKWKSRMRKTCGIKRGLMVRTGVRLAPLSALGDRSHSVEEKEWHTFLWLSGNPAIAALEHTRGEHWLWQCTLRKEHCNFPAFVYTLWERHRFSLREEGKETTEKKQRYREIKIKIKTFNSFMQKWKPVCLKRKMNEIGKWNLKGK